MAENSLLSSRRSLCAGLVPGTAGSTFEEMIYNFLKAHGPHKALTITKVLGLETKKEVNHNLYDMERKHLLHHDTNLDVWAVYRPEGSGRRNQPTTVIYQQNPVTMICQNGPNSQISIQNSEGIQIGHGNAMVKQMASGENGSTAPLHLPPTAPADPSAQGLPAGAWGPQDIHLEKSVLRRVQMGHGNEMNSASAPAEGPARSPFGSHPGLLGSRQQRRAGGSRRRERLSPRGGH